MLLKIHTKSMIILGNNNGKQWIDTIELNNAVYFILAISLSVMLCNDIPNVRQTSTYTNRLPNEFIQYLFMAHVLHTQSTGIILWKCLYQVGVITVFPVFRLLTDFVCLYTYEFLLSLREIVRISVIFLLPL